MEYEVESLVEDLGLPRDIIQEDVASGRLVLDQHRGDPKHYVDHEILVDYLCERVGELRRDHRRIFWQAVRKIMTTPGSKNDLNPEELQAFLKAIDRQIANS